MVRFDETGYIDTVQVVDICYNDRPIDYVLDSGNIYLTGYCRDTTDPASGQNIFLAKVDTLGNVLWHRTYDYVQWEEPRSIDRAHDGGFIIGGHFRNPTTQKRNLFLLKTDSLGNEEWRKTYHSGMQEQYYGHAVATLDGGYAIAGYREITSLSWYHGLLIKTDSLGTVQWEKLYGPPNEVHLFKFIKQDSLGNFLLAGGGDKPTVGKVPAWLMKTDANGDTIWSQYYSYYGGDTHTYVDDLILTSDGGYAMTGYTLGPIATRNDLWVMKTDHLGRTCDSPPCHAVLWDTGTAVLQLPAPARATLAPNPTTGLLMLTLAEPLPREAMLTIYDVQGRTRRQWRLPAGQRQYTIHLGLPAGLYLIRLTSEGTMAWSGKVVVE